MVCTQPRRISAISLAARVAEERGETVGEVIGFSVRNQRTTSNRTRILYCTTGRSIQNLQICVLCKCTFKGILLRQLNCNPELRGVSHVVIDEVHERSIEMDLLLFVLRKMLQKRQKQTPKIILMSATTVAADFQNYFNSAVLSLICVISHSS